MSQPEQKSASRRVLLALAGGAVVAWVAGVPYLARNWPRDQVFSPIIGMDAFRRLDNDGPLSTASAALIGIERAAALTDVDRQVRAAPCEALYGGWDSEAVPIALFSDFNCPNCVVMDAHLAALADATPAAVRIVHHQLPLLGPASVTAARAVLAAAKQDAEEAMRQRLTGTRAITHAGLVRVIAQELGLDPEQLARDMNTEAITRQIEISQALARSFGLIGTPSAVIGRTVVLGTISPGQLRSLVSTEAAAGPFQCTSPS